VAQLWIDISDIYDLTGKFTGVSRVVYKVAAHLTSTHTNVRLFTYCGDSKSFKSVVFEIEENEFSRFVKTEKCSWSKEDTVLFLGGMWNDPNEIEVLRLEKEKCKFKQIIFIHDIIPWSAPQYTRPNLENLFKLWLNKAVKFTDHIFVNSDATKSDVEKFLSENSLAIPTSLIPLAADEPEIKDTLVSEEKYILMVGTVQPRKNYQLLYQALKKLVIEGRLENVKVKLAGALGWESGPIVSLFKRDPDLSDVVEVLGPIDDSTLGQLYQNCLFTVYPSLYEGWGLPVSESLAYGKHCITSKGTSMEEIAPELTVNIDPFDASEFARAILQGLDSNFRIEREERIRREFKSRTWGDCVEDIERNLLEVGH
tara:strand:+ start:91595 stop:92701 length:1107 start_codon:yes stop_codon:yes gene_type:complete